MKRDKESIARMNDEELREYELYLLHGHGIQESPYRDGGKLREVTCTEYEAYILASAMNFNLYGSMINRSSWETPVISYRLKKNE